MIDPSGSAPQRVLAVFEFWDIPRLGVAMYRDVPHVFRCVFDVRADEWSDVFLLKPLTAAELAAVEDAWGKWCEWYQRSRQGLESRESHPQTLSNLGSAASLEAILEVPELRAIRARAVFTGRRLEVENVSVEWSDVA